MTPTSERSRALTLVAVGMLLAGGTWLVYASGGTQHAWLHALYVPILLAGWAFGMTGAAAVALAAGLLVGPAMPLDVDAGLPQGPLSWLSRLVAFVGIGVVAGWLFGSARRRLHALAASEARWRGLVRHVPDLLLVQGRDGTIGYASPSIIDILGFTAEELRTEAVEALLGPSDVSRYRACRRGEAASPVELRFRHRDGSWRQLETTIMDLTHDPAVAAVVVNAKDVTEWRAAEAELRHQALHDPITGLTNRAGFEPQVEAAVSDRRATPALVVVRLDRLDNVSEQYGHAAGDRLVAAAAVRLREMQKPGDVLCRHADNEFAVLRPDVEGREPATALAEGLRTALQEPFTLGDDEVFLPASAGVALADDDEDRGTDQLLANAYTAMRAAPSGGERTATYHVGLRDHRATWLRMESALRKALQRGEFRVFYQPIVALPAGRLAGFEALLRWRHPSLGLVPPSEFVPIAEHSGAILPIGEWVLREATRQLARWRATVPAAADLSVSVNVSPRQLGLPDLATTVDAALHDARLGPDGLRLEITETALMADPDASHAQLSGLRVLGIGLAIDDFGTGYASLGHLHRFPVDTLKIAREFVTELSVGDDGDAIVGAIIGLARSLGLATVAEGVEHRPQAAELAGLGCDYLQGFLIDRPRPADAVDIDLLARRPPLVARA